MIVYGDRRADEDPRALASALLADCGVADRAPRWSADEARRRVLVGAGELAQGLIDHAFEVRGERDELGPLERASARLTLAAARALLGQGLAAEVAAVVHELLRAPLPRRVSVRVPEGYALYALLPEAYAEAARRAGGPLLAIGLRSIGTGLAAVVAAAAGGRALPPVTLRPVGHPFARTVRVGPALERWLLDAPAAARFAVVDEGPGLSGSSLNAVADWLEARGVPAERVLFFPHHAGDLGPQASPAHRERWARAPRFHAAVEPRALVGEPAAEDLSGGRWRARVHGPDAGAWPPVDARQERLKLLVRPRHGRPRLHKSAGLGRYGDAALARARTLDAAGLGPPVLGLERGFLVMSWLEGATPVDVALGRSRVDRRAVVASVAEYVAAVGRGLPRAPRAIGAAPAALLDMACHNAGAALGAEAARALSRWREQLPRLGSDLRPVATDCRMHAWEWLVLPDGRLLKTDGVDHHAGHDLIGCQDVAWDVAGAAVELELDPDERARVARAARRRDAAVVRFHEDCYLAFQLGRCWLAARAAAPDEAARLEAAGRRYAARLEGSLRAAAA